MPGNTIILVEHDMQVIAACDWVIDMGPGAGDEGGKVIGFGPPEQIANLRQSKTGGFLKRKLAVFESGNSQDKKSKYTVPAGIHQKRRKARDKLDTIKTGGDFVDKVSYGHQARRTDFGLPGQGYFVKGEDSDHGMSIVFILPTKNNSGAVIQWQCLIGILKRIRSKETVSPEWTESSPSGTGRIRLRP